MKYIKIFLLKKFYLNISCGVEKVIFENIMKKKKKEYQLLTIKKMKNVKKICLKYDKIRKAEKESKTNKHKSFKIRKKN